MVSLAGARFQNEKANRENKERYEKLPDSATLKIGDYELPFTKKEYKDFLEKKGEKSLELARKILNAPMYEGGVEGFVKSFQEEEIDDALFGLYRAFLDSHDQVLKRMDDITPKLLSRRVDPTILKIRKEEEEKLKQAEKSKIDQVKELLSVRNNPEETKTFLKKLDKKSLMELRKELPERLNKYFESSSKKPQDLSSNILKEVNPILDEVITDYTKAEKLAAEQKALEEEKKPQNQIQVKTAGEQAKEAPKIPPKVSSVKTPVATASKANVPLPQKPKEVSKKESEEDELKDFSIPNPKDVLDAVRNKDIDKLEELSKERPNPFTGDYKKMFDTYQNVISKWKKIVLSGKPINEELLTSFSNPEKLPNSYKSFISEFQRIQKQKQEEAKPQSMGKKTIPTPDEVIGAYLDKDLDKLNELSQEGENPFTDEEDQNVYKDYMRYVNTLKSDLEAGRDPNEQLLKRMSAVLPNAYEYMKASSEGLEEEQKPENLVQALTRAPEYAQRDEETKDLDREVEGLREIAKKADYLAVPKVLSEIPPVSLEPGQDYLSAAPAHALENLRQVLNRFISPTEFDAHVPLADETLKAVAMQKQFGEKGLEAQTKAAEAIDKQLKDLADKTTMKSLLQVLANPKDEGEYNRAKELVSNEEFLNAAKNSLLQDEQFRKTAKHYLTNKDIPTLAQTALKESDTSLAGAEEALGNIPDMSKDYDLDKNEEELFQQKWKSFVDQATRNFEQNEERRTNNRFAGRDVWKSGAADTYRKEIQQDFNRALMEKQIAIREAARAESLKRKEMFDEERARKASIMLQVAQRKAEIARAQQQNKQALAQGYSSLAQQNMERAAQFQRMHENEQNTALSRAGRQLEMQDVRQRMGSNYANIQNMRAQQERDRIAQLAQAEALREAHIKDLINQYQTRGQNEQDKYQSRVLSLANAGDVLMGDKARYKDVMGRQIKEMETRPLENALLFTNASHRYQLATPSSFEPHRPAIINQMAVPPQWMNLPAPYVNQGPQQAFGIASTLAGLYGKQQEMNMRREEMQKNRSSGK